MTLLAVVIGLSTVGGAAIARDNYPALFDTSEVRSERLSVFPKWRGALARYFDERALARAPCASRQFNGCHLAQWQRFLESLRGRTPLTQVHEVNRYMNHRPYITDPHNYGVVDYWASPGQFLTRDGDCEDYAIAKFMSLRALGFDNRHLRIVVLNDLNLGIAHAILVVYHDGRALVLDNQIDHVVPSEVIRHYQPIYSLNEQYWWLHRS